MEANKTKTLIPKVSKCKKLSKIKSKTVKSIKKVEEIQDAFTEVQPVEFDKIKCEPIISESGDKVELRTMEEIYALDSSVIPHDLKTTCNKAIYITKKEKQCLEEIKSLISKIRLPSDDRQMHFFNRDVDKFSSTVSLLELEAPQKELIEAAKAIEESPSNIVVTDLNAIATYLNELKTLMAMREVAWATATKNSYSQKLEIFNLKNKVDHLKTICTKRQNDISEKDKIIENKDTEIVKQKKYIERLKFEIIQLSKNRDNEIGYFGTNRRQFKDESCKIVNHMTSELGNLGKNLNNNNGSSNMVSTGVDVRRNHGPAALLANALYKARNKGNFINVL